MTSKKLSVFQINRILHREWDPIGVNNIENTEDEYIGYANQVYHFLINKKGENSIFNYLLKVELEYLGTEPDKKNLEKISKKIASMNKQSGLAQVEISNVSQLRAQARLAIQENKPFNLIISPRTKTISEGVMKNIETTNGKVFEFNPSTKKFTEIMNNSEKFTR